MFRVWTRENLTEPRKKVVNNEKEIVKGTRAIIDHSNTRKQGRKVPRERKVSLPFVDDVIYRLNGNYGTLEKTSHASKDRPNAVPSEGNKVIQMHFFSIHEWHFKIFN